MRKEMLQADMAVRDWINTASTAASPLFVLVGTWLGYRLASRSRKEGLHFEKKVEAVADFLRHANDCLQYLVEWQENPSEGGPARLQLTVLGTRAALFMSNEAASHIDEYTSSYAKALQKQIDAQVGGQARPNVFNGIRDQLEALTKTLRVEIKP